MSEEDKKAEESKNKKEKPAFTGRYNDDDDSDLEYLDDMPAIMYPDEPRNKINRGDEYNITKKDPTIKDIMVGVGWDLKVFDSSPLDLDASVFLLSKHNKTRVDSDFVFYNNLSGCDGGVRHMGDSRTGAGDGDDETIMIDLNALPFDVMNIAFVLSIYDLEYMGHDFSMVKNVYFRVVNQNTDHEIFRYELDEELTGTEGLIIGVLERVGTEWIFRAVGETVKGGLGKIAQNYGIVVMQIVQD